MKLRLAFSPCPNDTFIFDAMIHHKIDTEGLSFDYTIADVEELNNRGITNEFDVTKMSVASYFKVSANYVILNAGNALGRGCGPLLICKNKPNFGKPERIRIGIPGWHTTANMLCSIFLPFLKNKQQLLFSQIEDALLSNWIDAGVIIHENRFTYEAKGLQKIVDLGEVWEKQTNMPIPLGCIAARRWYDKELMLKISRVIARSIIYAYANPTSVMPFIKMHAQNMDERVIRQHIDLYVNGFSFDLNWQGRDAIRLLADKAVEHKVVDIRNRKFFIQDI